MAAQCNICLEILLPAAEAELRVTKCGHAFHAQCLNNWMRTDKTCPQCRTKLTAKSILKLFLELSPEGTSDGLKEEVDKLKLALERAGEGARRASEEKDQVTARLTESQNQLQQLRQTEIPQLQNKCAQLEEDHAELQVMYNSAIQTMEDACRRTNELKEENKFLEDQLLQSTKLQEDTAAKISELQKQLQMTEAKRFSTELPKGPDAVIQIPILQPAQPSPEGETDDSDVGRELWMTHRSPGDMEESIAPKRPRTFSIYGNSVSDLSSSSSTNSGDVSE